MTGKAPFPYRIARALYLLASDRDYRILMWARLRRPKKQFQLTNITRPDRYPKINRFVQ